MALSADITLVVGYVLDQNGTCSKRRALRRPAVISGFLEVLQRHIRARLALRGGRFGQALDGEQTRLTDRAVAQTSADLGTSFQADGILQVTEQLELDRLIAEIFDAIAHHRRRQRRIFNVQGYERRERLQLDLHGTVVIAIGDSTDRVTTVERDVRKAIDIQRASFIADRYGEALLHWLDQRGRVDVVQATGDVTAMEASRHLMRTRLDAGLIPVEDVPQPQSTVARQVQRAGEQPAYGHADVLQRLRVRIRFFGSARGAM